MSNPSSNQRVQQIIDRVDSWPPGGTLPTYQQWARDLVAEIKRLRSANEKSCEPQGPDDHFGQ